MFDYVGLECVLCGFDGVIFSVGYYFLWLCCWQEEVVSVLGQINLFYVVCLQVRVLCIFYVGLVYVMFCYFQGLLGYEGLFYDSLLSGKSFYVLCKWVFDEQVWEQVCNGLLVVIGIFGMVFGELDIGLIIGCVIIVIGNGEMIYYVVGQCNVIDVVEVGCGLLMVFECGCIGECYLLIGYNLEMVDLIWCIVELFGQFVLQLMLMVMVCVLVILGCLCYWVSGQLLLFDEIVIEVMVGGQFFDGCKVCEEFGFFFIIVFDDILLCVIDWFCDNGYFNVQDGWLGQCFFCEGLGLQFQLGVKVFYVEYGVQFL